MEKHIEILVDCTEYITKEESYQAINEQYHETGLDGYQDGIELMNRIAKIPAADVVEVVRCIDCKYDERCFLQGFVRDKRVEPYDKTMFFCSDGKRKNGGQDDV